MPASHQNHPEYHFFSFSFCTESYLQLNCSAMYTGAGYTWIAVHIKVWTIQFSIWQQSWIACHHYNPISNNCYTRRIERNFIIFMYWIKWAILNGFRSFIVLILCLIRLKNRHWLMIVRGCEWIARILNLFRVAAACLFGTFRLWAEAATTTNKTSKTNEYPKINIILEKQNEVFDCKSKE